MFNLKHLYKKFSKVTSSALISLFLFFISVSSFALVYYLPENGDNIIGNMRIKQVKKDDTFVKLVREYEMGHDEMVKANPKIPIYGKLKDDKALIIPSFFILPDTPHKGITINLPELRLYYYPPNHNAVITEPVAVGRLGWSTPLILTKVVEKIKNPSWDVPESIRTYSAERGIYLPPVVPPGPENPLGDFALRLGAWSVLIHGTNQPYHIGKRVSSGCIRMYPEDIKYLFYAVAEGTPVRIIDQPYKVGWLNKKLYLEAHLPFLENRDMPMEELEKVRQIVLQATYNHPASVDWRAVVLTLAKHNGFPQIIGKKLS